MKHKIIQVLEALYAGQRIKIDGYEYAMSDDHRVGIIMQHSSSDNPDIVEDVILCPDIDLNYFIKLCDKVPQDALFIKGAERVLMESRRRKL